MYDDLEIVFKKSAFRHGATEDDINWAFKTVESDELVIGSKNTYRLFGFNTKGNMLEVLYNLINDHKVNVFHAYPCSDAYLESLARKGVYIYGR